MAEHVSSSATISRLLKLVFKVTVIKCSLQTLKFVRIFLAVFKVEPKLLIYLYSGYQIFIVMFQKCLCFIYKCSVHF